MYPFSFIRLFPNPMEDYPLITGRYIVDNRENTFIRKDEDVAGKIFDYLRKCRERDITESDIPYLSDIANEMEIPIHKLDEDSFESQAIQGHLTRWSIGGR